MVGIGGPGQHEISTTGRMPMEAVKLKSASSGAVLMGSPTPLNIPTSSSNLKAQRAGTV